MGGLDEIHIMFDNNHGVAPIYEALQDCEENFNVKEVQPRGRLVEGIQRVTRSPFCELFCKFQSLSLAPRECGGGLTQLHVPKTYVNDSLEDILDFRDILEEFKRLRVGH